MPDTRSLRARQRHAGWRCLPLTPVILSLAVSLSVAQARTGAPVPRDPLTPLQPPLPDIASERSAPGPTTESGTAGADPLPMQLQAILVSAGRQLVVIDGTLLRVGARLGDARIQRILPRTVVLTASDGSQSNLTFLPGGRQ